MSSMFPWQKYLLCHQFEPKKIISENTLNYGIRRMPLLITALLSFMAVQVQMKISIVIIVLIIVWPHASRK